MIVVKFGGTSIQDAEAMSNAVEIVQTKISCQPIVVLSAVAGVTDALIKCARLASEDKEAEALEVLEGQIVAKHYGIIQGLIKGLTEQDATIRQFSVLFSELRNLLRGISITGDLSKRVLDFVLSYGERMSTTLVVTAMQERNVPGVHVDSRNCIITNETFGKAEPDVEATSEKCRATLLPIIQRGDIPVMQGFIGATPKGITSTLGRGGSDYTAAIVGAVLHVDDIEIWTDVDGILTADPKIVPNAKRVKVMSFQEASELAYFGAKVLHPSTLLPAVEKNIPVHIYNSRRPHAAGTLVKANVEPTNVCVKSVSYKKNITVINISSTRMLGSHGFMKKIFDTFNDFETSVDLVTTSEVSVSLSIDHTPSTSVGFEGLVKELSTFGRVNVESDKAIVCIVGERIKDEKGLASRIFGRLKDINIHMISQGSSEINITFVIDEKDIPFAVKELHDEFFTHVDGDDVFE